MTHIDHGGTWHEASFRLVETYDVTVDAQWRIDLDHQPYGEIVHVLSGCCRFVQGDRLADVGPGGLGILLPGQDRSTRAVGGGPLRFTGFGFRVELHGAVELSGLLGLPLHLPTPGPTTLGLVTQAVHSGRPTSPGPRCGPVATPSSPPPNWSSGTAPSARSPVQKAAVVPRSRRRWD